MAYFTPATIPRRLGGSASGGGGGVRSRLNASSDPQNDATSTTYAHSTPAAAISTPASAGEPIVAISAKDQFSAVAAFSSSRSTTRGSSASSGGRSTAVAAANSAAAA